MRLKAILFHTLFLISQLGISQTNLCSNVYLWDFKSSTNERNHVTKALSNEVEDILTQMNECKVLQRRIYSDIQKQVENETQISNVEGISYDLKKKLKTIQAERVLFGEVEQDFSFNVNLRLRLEHLQTKQIKTKTILLMAEKMINPKLRTEVIKKELSELLGLKNVESIRTPQRNSTKPEYDPINIEGHKIELEGCSKEGGNLKCYLHITSIGKDRLIYLMAKNYQGETIVVDEFGKNYTSNGVKLGEYYSPSNIYQKEIFEDVRTPLEYTFNDFSSKTNLIKVLKLDIHTEELQFTDVKFRNIQIE